MKFKAVNWNALTDDYSLTFWNQNTKQFWLEKEIPLTDDKNTWATLPEEVKKAYKQVLVKLTGLDTKQGGDGMPLVALHIEDDQKKAVLSFMGTMEHIHAKSYSSIFSTLLPKEEIDELFKWAEDHPVLQDEADIVVGLYHELWNRDASPLDLYKAMVASVMNESFLFYSGFFLPLILSGQGDMTASGEIINLIIRDESIHGLYVGQLAKEIYEQLSDSEKAEAVTHVYSLLVQLMSLEEKFTEEIYAPIGLVDEVKEYLKYNANKALMNLGFGEFYPDVEINPIVLNGLNTNTKQHDFFSMKGNSYFMAQNVEHMRDEDFSFEGV